MQRWECGISATLLSTVILLTCSIQGALAKTLRVEKDGTGDFRIIQGALYAAAPGDSILIGPGRFDDSSDVLVGCCWEATAYGAIADSNLTIVGAGLNTTIIGPAQPVDSERQTVGFTTLSELHDIRISEVTIENAEFAVYVYGRLDLRDSAIRSASGAGVYSDYPGPSNIQRTHFIDCYYGIWMQDTRGVRISACEFAGVSHESVNTWGCTALRIDGCQIEGPQIGISITQGSSVSISESNIAAAASAIGIAGWSDAQVYGSTLSGGESAVLAVSAGRVDAYRCRLTGGEATVRLHDTSDVQFAHNDFTRGGPWMVFLSEIHDMNGEKLDFKNNWWGTTDADSIQSWIVDADHPIHENDPNEEGYVEFLPLLEQSVPAEQSSVGGLKGRFKRN